MRVADLIRLYDYSYWANAKLFDVIRRLSAEEFTRPVAGSYGSIRNTLVHTVSAEWGWLDRAGGPRRGPRLNADDYPTAESVIARWEQVERDMRSFLSALHDHDLERPVEFELPPGERHVLTMGTMLQHGANHAVHHRGQVALLLRMLGHTPGNVDLLFYDLSSAAESGATGGSLGSAGTREGAPVPAGAANSGDIARRSRT